MSNQITSTVKWFDTTKGYGFINGPDEDVFVHYRDLNQPGFKNLREGDQVEFIQERTDTGLRASDVNVICAQLPVG